MLRLQASSNVGSRAPPVRAFVGDRPGPVTRGSLCQWSGEWRGRGPTGGWSRVGKKGHPGAEVGWSDSRHSRTLFRGTRSCLLCPSANSSLPLSIHARSGPAGGARVL